MLSKNPGMNVITMLKRIYREEGAKRLFSGVSPRVTWISIGGFVFFGSFEATKKLVLETMFDS